MLRVLIMLTAVLRALSIFRFQLFLLMKLLGTETIPILRFFFFN